MLSNWSSATTAAVKPIPAAAVGATLTAKCVTAAATPHGDGAAARYGEIDRIGGGDGFGARGFQRGGKGADAVGQRRLAPEQHRQAHRAAAELHGAGIVGRQTVERVQRRNRKREACAGRGAGGSADREVRGRIAGGDRIAGAGHCEGCGVGGGQGLEPGRRQDCAERADAVRQRGIARKDGAAVAAAEGDRAAVSRRDVVVDVLRRDGEAGNATPVVSLAGCGSTRKWVRGAGESCRSGC